MRADCKVAAALSLSLLAGACGKPDESVATSTAATTATPALEAAPQSYKRMRFVSDVEQARGTEVAAKPRVGHDMQHMAATAKPASETTNSATDAVATMAAAAPAPVLATEQAVPDQGIVVAARPAPEPQVAHGGPSAEGDVLDHAGTSGRGIGEVLAGIAGGAVIRGGPASVRKCDPRSDGYGGRARPDLMMPSPVRQVFGGTRR